MSRIILGVVLAAACTCANATVFTQTLSPANIVALSTDTSRNGTASANNIAVLQTSSGVLQSPCNGIFLDTVADRSTYSLLLVAFTTQRSITITYDTQQSSPWGNPAWCALVGASISP